MTNATEGAAVAALPGGGAAQLRSARAMRPGWAAGAPMPVVLTGVALEAAAGSVLITAAGAAGSVLMTATGAAALLADVHPMAAGEALRLPPFMALAVAVQPAPGVEVGGLDCATAMLPTARVAAAIRVVRVIFMVMAETPGN